MPLQHFDTTSDQDQFTNYILSQKQLQDMLIPFGQKEGRAKPPRPNDPDYEVYTPAEKEALALRNQNMFQLKIRLQTRPTETTRQNKSILKK